jgi:hypothetical protein
MLYRYCAERFAVPKEMSAMPNFPGFQQYFKVLKQELFESEEAKRARRVASTSTPEAPAAPQSQPDVPVCTGVDEFLEINTGVGAGIARLQEHNRALEQQLQTVQTHLVLPQEEQHCIVSRLRQTLQETRQELLAIQDANIRLEQRLHEKRLLLDTKGKALEQVAQREAKLYATITELRRDSARLTHEVADLQSQLAQREMDFERVRQQYTTLSQEHETFVGKYHRLFQEYNREQRNKQKA